MEGEDELQSGADASGMGDTQVEHAPAQPPPAPPPPAPPAGEQHVRSVPLDVFLRQREELTERSREAQRRADQAEARLQEIEAARREQESQLQIPNQFADPEGYTQFLMHRMQTLEQSVDQRARQYAESLVTEDRVTRSEERWSGELGADRWSELNAWIEEQPPQALAHFKRQPDPYGAAAKEMKRQRALGLLAEHDYDPDALVNARMAKLQEQQAAAQAPQQVQPSTAAQPKHRPTSLSSTPGVAPASNRAGPASGYDALFRKA